MKEQSHNHDAVYAIAGAAPQTDQQLAGWIEQHLHVRVPTQPLIESHSAPLEYLAHAFFEDRQPRDCVVWANRGGGKTFYAAIATLLDMIFKPGIEIRILAGSLDQAKRMHTHLRALLATEPLEELIEGKITERKIKLINGSIVELLAQSQTSVRGTRVQKLRCDEVELFDKDVWEAAQLTIREKHCASHNGGTDDNKMVPGSIECLSTLHVPFGLMHELVTTAKENNQQHRKLFQWGVVDILDQCTDQHQCQSESSNCDLLDECNGKAKARDAAGQTPGHLTVNNAIALKSRVSQSTWDAEMLCLRPKRTDCVLPEFNHQIHINTQLPDPSTITQTIAGMDFGIRAPTVILYASLDHAGTLWVTSEYLKSDTPLTQHIQSIKEQQTLTPLNWIGVDPAGRQRANQTGISDIAAMRKAALTVRDNRMSIHQGLGLIRARLNPATGTPTLMIHKSCEHLIKCLETYHYPQDQPLNPTPEKDGSDHAIDALRYMIQNLDQPYTHKKSTYFN